MDPSQRLELINKVLATTPDINFVAIDGIIDLDIDPILQADQAQNIVSHLMKWTEIYNTHIVCVLHYNKTVATLLGHLGSFSHRKADAIIEVSKSKDDENISLVKSLDCREKEFLPFAFSVDLAGMPYILEDYTFEKTAKEKKESGEAKQKVITPSDLAPTQHTELLTMSFQNEREQSYKNIIERLKYSYDKLFCKSIGVNKAGEFLTYYVKTGYVFKAMQGKKVVYLLPGLKELDLPL